MSAVPVIRFGRWWLSFLDRLIWSWGWRFAWDLLDREPDIFPRAAARWAGRFTLERKVTLSDAQLTLAALASLIDGKRSAGGQALAALCQHYQLDRGEQLLADWIARRPRRE